MVRHKRSLSFNSGFSRQPVNSRLQEPHTFVSGVRAPTERQALTTGLANAMTYHRVALPMGTTALSLPFIPPNRQNPGRLQENVTPGGLLAVESSNQALRADDYEHGG